MVRYGVVSGRAVLAMENARHFQGWLFLVCKGGCPTGNDVHASGETYLVFNGMLDRDWVPPP